MDYLAPSSFLDSRSPFDSTFNFWNDYLGLSGLVSSARGPGPPFGPNSITESLKATLGLEDESVPDGPDGDAAAAAAHLDSYGRQHHHHHHHHLHHLQQQQHHHLPGERDPDPDLSGLELLSLARRRKPSPGGRGKPEPKVCVFCRNNGAPEEVYGTHVLKAADGRVLCPILRAYTCPLCSANGDHAHTIKYCPLSRDGTGTGTGAGAPGHRPSSRARGGGGGGTGKRLRVY